MWYFKPIKFQVDKLNYLNLLRNNGVNPSEIKVVEYGIYYFGKHEY